MNLAKPEILAPAGAMPQLKAAVHAGADAVYFGLSSGFNARVRADSFAAEDLEAVMQYLHSHNCKGFLTLNILVFDEELEALENYIRHAAHCGVDALIVQDLGAIEIARKTAPNLPIHGSTQLSITDEQGADFIHSLGAERIVVGRELSIEAMKQIAENSAIEIETFVHGALCVSYSGQCFSSEAWGGRSANRGQCAQACRLPYKLIVNGLEKQQGDFNYLLSPQDLMALQQVPRLIDAGVSCFKIEGRLKGPEYVLSTVAAYREAVDNAWERKVNGEGTEHLAPIKTATRRRLAQVFSRGQGKNFDGLSPGFLEGSRHQELVIGRNPRHRGLYLGRVEGISSDGITLELNGPVKAGDGVVFDQGKPQQREAGGNVFYLYQNKKLIRDEIDHGQVTLNFGKSFDYSPIQIDDIIWRTKDSSMDAGTKLSRQNQIKAIKLRIEIIASLNKTVRLALTDQLGHRAVQETQKTTQTAKNAPLDLTSLRKAIGQLGDTPFEIESIQANIDDKLFIPLGEIKQARREAIEKLQQQLLIHQRDKAMPSSPVLKELLAISHENSQTTTEDKPEITLLCRTREQVDAAVKIESLKEIIVDFLEVQGLKDACERVKLANKKLIVAAPRIFKPGEHRLVRYYCHLKPDALLVRSTGLLWQLHQLGGAGKTFDEESIIPALWGDFSLNASNQLSAEMLLQMGLSRLSLTHDLNADQITALTKSLNPTSRNKIEVITHQHLPIFHTEHCVFARFLSKGNSKKDCGRPCEKNHIHIQDPQGSDHIVLADIGCRNTVFNAQAQSAAPYTETFQKAGIKHYRIELVDEPSDQVSIIVDGYLAQLQGQQNHQQLWKTLKHVPDANNNPQGVGLGSLSVRIEQLKATMKKPSAR